jgi:multidrug efflux pump subunit AcrB
MTGSSQFAPVRFLDQSTGNEYPINVRLNDQGRSETSDLAEIYLRGSTAASSNASAQGSLIALGSVARIERNAGPVLISRKYLQRIVDVTANIAAQSSLGEAAAAVQATIAELPPPDGFSVRVGGQAEAQQQAFAGLTWAALLAIVLVYMVLASQFKSLLSPLIILCSVPLGLAGVLIMLWATGTTLSVNSFMGIIMMVGIVVSNGVLLVDYANVLRRRGSALEAATVEAGRTRLRPILMTTVATIVGLLPMALGIGEGSETNLPLARAVIGGLTVSTFFTLFFIPALYSLLGRFTAVGSDDEDDLISQSQEVSQVVPRLG